MGIDTSAMLILGLTAEELKASFTDEQREKLDELGWYEYVGQDGGLGLEDASPYYDSDYQDRVWGVTVACTGGYQARRVPPGLKDALDAAEKKFREATGLEGKLYLSPHVT